MPRSLAVYGRSCNRYGANISVNASQSSMSQLWRNLQHTLTHERTHLRPVRCSCTGQVFGQAVVLAGACNGCDLKTPSAVWLSAVVWTSALGTVCVRLAKQLSGESSQQHPLPGVPT